MEDGCCSSSDTRLDASKEIGHDFPRTAHGNVPLLAGNAPTSYERSLVEGLHDVRLKRQFRRLADNIWKDFPSATGGTLLFAGVGSSSHIADVAGHLARQLSLPGDGDILLVDADATLRVLSQRFAATSNSGLAEVLQQKRSAATVVIPTAVANLWFLPFGQRLNERIPTASAEVKSLLTELRRTYRYVVVAAGTGGSLLHSLISRHCDGTYLVVQLGTADRQETADLAGHLTAAGARLLGCVATGVF